jgi:hypothetical protein
MGFAMANWHQIVGQYRPRGSLDFAFYPKDWTEGFGRAWGQMSMAVILAAEFRLVLGACGELQTPGLQQQAQIQSNIQLCPWIRKQTRRSQLPKRVTKQLLKSSCAGV